MPVKKSGIYFVWVAIALSCFQLICGWNVLPLAGSDSIVFLPPALFFSRSLGFINPLYFVSHFADLSGHDYFNYYVPLFPLVLGWLGKIHPGVRGLFLICSGFSAIQIWCYCGQLRGLARSVRGKWQVVLYILSVFYLATYLLPTMGRPEILSSLLALGVYIWYQRKPVKRTVYWLLPMGSLFALLLCTQLLGFYFSFLIFLTFEFSNQRPLGQQLIDILWVIASTIVATAIILAISPLPVTDVAMGVTRHIHYVLQRTDRSLHLYFYYWFYTSVNFGFIFIAGLASFFYIPDIRQRTRVCSVASRWIVWICVVMVAIGVVRFVLFAAPTVYNLTQFISPFLLYLFIRVKRSRIAVPAGGILGIIFTFGAVIVVRILCLVPDYLNDGRSFDSVSTILSSKMQTMPPDFVSPGLWALCPDPSSIKITGHNSFKSGQIVLLQGRARDIPESVTRNWEVIFDTRIKPGHLVLGIPVRHPDGYTFTFYRVP